MILTCSAHDADFEVPLDATLHVSFDTKEVSLRIWQLLLAYLASFVHRLCIAYKFATLRQSIYFVT